MADEQAQSIGAARVDIVINLDDYKAEIERAKGLAAGLGKDFEASFQKMTGSSKRATAEALKLSQTWGKNADEIKLLTLAARGAAPEALEALRQRMAAVRLEAGKSGAQFNAYGLSAKQTAAALRQVPAQLTDITVGLATGQRPLYILLQQGGQLKDLFGGIKPAAKAVGTALLGLINPFTVTAAAAAGLAIVFNQGEKESLAFNKALILTRNAAGVTADQLAYYASKVGDVVGTHAKAADVLAQLAATGEVAGDQLQGAATAAIRLERTAGIAASETVKNLAALGRDPVGASKKLNEQYHYLTASVYAQIRALQDEGKTAQAAALAQQTYYSAANDQAQKLEHHLGLFPELALHAGDAFKKMWDAFLNIGRPDTLQSQLDDAEARLAQLLDRKEKGTRTRGLGDQIDAATRKVEQLRLIVKLYEQDAKKAAEEQRENDKLLADGDIRYAQSLRDRQALEKYFSDRRAAQFNSNVAAIQRAASTETEALSHEQELLEAKRSAGLVSEADYYEQRRRLIESATSIQVRALRQQNAALSKESDRLADEAASARALADSLFGQGAKEYADRLADAARKEDAARRAKLQNAEQIKANNAEIAKQTSDQAAKTEVLAAVEQGRLAALTRSYDQAKAAADNYLVTLGKQYALEEKNQFAGNRQREFDSGRASIQDKYAQQRQQVEIDQSNNPTVDPKIYEQRRALIDSNLQTELSLYEDHWAKLRAGETNWRNGATEAIANYVEDARDIASQTSSIVSNALKQGEDAWVHFVQTGKLSAKSLVSSVIADFARLQFKQLLGGLLGGAGGGGGIGGFLGSLFGGFRAGGGDTEPGKAYIVGEKRPEIFVPRTAGRIIPSLAMAAAGGSIVNHNSFAVTVQAPNGRISRETESQLSVALVRAVQRGARNVR